MQSPTLEGHPNETRLREMLTFHVGLKCRILGAFQPMSVLSSDRIPNAQLHTFPSSGFSDDSKIVHRLGFSSTVVSILVLASRKACFEAYFVGHFTFQFNYSLDFNGTGRFKMDVKKEANKINGKNPRTHKI